MKKSKTVSPEAVEALGLMFPGVHRNELTNFLKENDFDEAVDLLNQIYPQDQKSDDQDYDYDYESDDNNIEALSNSIPFDDKKDMIKDIQSEFPNFDDEVCMVFLEDSKFNVEVAKKEAHATQQLYLHHIEVSNTEANLVKLRKEFPKLSDLCLSNALEAACGDYSMACTIIRESIQEDKKPKK